MSDIDDLRRRVSEAEQSFGHVNEECTRYGERMVALMETLEGRLRAQRSITEHHTAEVAALEAKLTAKQDELERKARDNEQLRGMLHSLLRAFESGGRHSVTEAMRELDRKISGLVGGPAGLAPARAMASDAILEAMSGDFQAAEESEGDSEDFGAEVSAWSPDAPSDESENEDAGAEIASNAFEDVGPETLAAEVLSEVSKKIRTELENAQDSDRADKDDAADGAAVEGEPVEAFEPAPESSGSLSDIMARVSRLVRDADRAERIEPHRHQRSAETPSASAPADSHIPLRRSTG